MITVQTIKTMDELAALAPAWKALWSRCPRATIFDAPEFILTWFKHFGASWQMNVGAAWDGENLVGVAPVVVGTAPYNGLPVRMLTFMNNKHVSRSDVLVQPGHENEVRQALVRSWWDMRRDYDAVRMVNVPRANGTLPALRSCMENTGFTPFGPEGARQLSVLPFDRSWESYQKSQSANFRASLRNCMNRIARDSELHTIVHRDVSEVDRSMAMLFDVQERSWKGEDPDAWQNPQDQLFYTELARTLATSGGFVNRFLLKGDVAIAGLFELIYGDTDYSMLVFYDMAHKALSPGRYLFALALAEGFSGKKLARMDFNGDSSFVRCWATSHQDFDVLSATHTGVYSRVLGGLKLVKRLSAGKLTGGAA